MILSGGVLPTVTFDAVASEGPVCTSGSLMDAAALDKELCPNLISDGSGSLGESSPRTLVSAKLRNVAKFILLRKSKTRKERPSDSSKKRKIGPRERK